MVIDNDFGILGEGDFFFGFEFFECAVNGLETIADGIEKSSTGGYGTADGDRDDAIDAPARLLQLNVPDAELAIRRAAWKAPAPRYTRGVLAKYAKLVSSSHLGAVTDLGLG